MGRWETQTGPAGGRACANARRPPGRPGGPFLVVKAMEGRKEKSKVEPKLILSGVLASLSSVAAAILALQETVVIRYMFLRVHAQILG